MKKGKMIFTVIGVIAIAVLTVFVFKQVADFNTSSPNQLANYFNDYSKKFVKYDSESNNIDEAGTYWNMTSKKDQNITIYVSADTATMYSTLYLYQNGTQVQSATDTGVYMYAYILNLKKGDKLSFHGFWTNGLMTDETGFKISYFVIKTENGMYPINDFQG